MTTHEIEIILIEDNPDDAALTMRAFSESSLFKKMVHLKNGQEAIDYLFNGAEFDGSIFDHHPKVILLDLKMPKVDGTEVLKKIKTNPETKMIPVVILTSSAEDPDIKKCYELGANSYIVKPVDFETFSKTIINIAMYWLVINQTN